MKKRIGLLYGGKSAEHEVSLSTARAVTGALNFEEYEVYPIFITTDGEWRRGERLEKPVSAIEELQLIRGNRLFYDSNCRSTSNELLSR